MITGTTTLAIRTLLYLAKNTTIVTPPRRIAEELGESPTYLAKVCGHLVRSGLLRAEKGVKGGVQLGRAPAEITLLAIVEACQGPIVGSYCRTECDASLTCAYHRAAQQLQQAIVAVLSKWTLAQLMKPPRTGVRPPSGLVCVMTGAAQPHYGRAS